MILGHQKGKPGNREKRVSAVQNGPLFMHNNRDKEPRFRDFSPQTGKQMISSKKILEGCLLAVSRDVSEKWSMQLDGCEVSALDDPLFPKETYLKLKYNQHLIPLYQLAGNNSVNLRAGLTTLAVEARKRGESTVMSDFPGLPSNLSLFKTTQQIAKEQWWREVQKQVVHTCLIIRDKKYTRIPSNELVLGDIVFVSAGDIVGADLRVIVCSPNSLMDISSITGLSNDFKELQEKPTDLNPLYVLFISLLAKKEQERRACTLSFSRRSLFRNRH